MFALQKEVFFSILDEKAVNSMSKQIAKTSGDIRVAFDIMKNSLQNVLN